eukprot:360003-Chlamydomonas_euryale.AAC.11
MAALADGQAGQGPTFAGVMPAHKTHGHTHTNTHTHTHTHTKTRTQTHHDARGRMLAWRTASKQTNTCPPKGGARRERRCIVRRGTTCSWHYTYTQIDATYTPSDAIVAAVARGPTHPSTAPAARHLSSPRAASYALTSPLAVPTTSATPPPPAAFLRASCKASGKGGGRGGRWRLHGAEWCGKRQRGGRG